jgi:hypothetical protein
MDALNPIPDALSFRQLAQLLEQAPAEPAVVAGTVAAAAGHSGEAADALQPLRQQLGSYARLSQELLAELERSVPALDGQLNSQQLLALGAFRTHLQMGLRALAASQREN